MNELAQRVQHAATFLQMAAIEMRRIADDAPDVAVALRHIARQIEAEAEDLAAQDI